MSFPVHMAFSVTKCQTTEVKGISKPEMPVLEKSTETPVPAKVFGQVSISEFVTWQERKAILPSLSWKSTNTEALIVEPKIVEVIKEVPVEIIKEIVREPDVVPIERLSHGTNTDPAPKPRYTINSFAEFHREKVEKPVIKVSVSTDVQSISTPPKLVIQNKTSSIELTPKASTLSPMEPFSKVFTFNYEGSSKSSQGNSLEGSPAIEKLQRRLKIYEDQCLKLQMEVDSLRNRHSGLYSKLNEKASESASHYQSQIEALKKENVHFKGLCEKLKQEAEKSRLLAIEESNIKIVGTFYC